MFRAALISAAAISLSTSAGAVTYSVAGNFGSSVFAYGSGVGGLSFTAFGQHNACAPQLDCYNDGGLPQVAKAVNGTYSSNNVIIPAGDVHLHPGSGGGSTDAIIRFIAPTAGTYTISGSFARQDATGNGNGVVGSIFLGATSLFSSTIANSSYGTSTAFNLLNVNLLSGQTVDFVVNNRGDYTFDSTGLAATISSGAVPELASWALMFGGFGLVGFAARRRKTATRVTFA